MGLAKKNKYNIILIGLIVFSVSLIWFVIRPAIYSMQDNNQKIIDEKNDLTELLKSGQSVIENERNLKIIQAEIYKLDKAWLKIGEELNFITDLEKIASKNKLEQTLFFDNTKFETKSEIRIIPIELRIKGNLENILNYINDLELLDYYVSIDKIAISSQLKNTVRANSKQIINNGTGDSQIEVRQLSVNLNGVTYWK